MKIHRINLGKKFYDNYCNHYDIYDNSMTPYDTYDKLSYNYDIFYDIYNM